MVHRTYFTTDAGVYLKDEVLKGDNENSPASVLLRCCNILSTIFCIIFTYKAYEYGVKDLIERNMVAGNSKGSLFRHHYQPWLEEEIDL